MNLEPYVKIKKHQDRCTRGFLVSDAVLLEIGNGLARNYKQEAIEVIEDFFDSEEVEIVRLTSELFERAFELYNEVQR